jgi:8-oxo-dGTP pyrophosphatase MutT (NUDIX family)
MRAMDPEGGRGGAQVIPRPAGFRLGDPPPWNDLSEAERHLDLAEIERRMAATGAARRSPREDQVSKASAVLAPLYVDGGEVHVMLTRRSAALRVHGGEVSFPGGRQEPGEELFATARREAFEEVGLDPAAVRLIGELDHLTTITSDSFIVPYVGVLPGRPQVVVSPAEVAAVLFVPLAELLDPSHYREERWDLWGTERPIFFFELEGDTVWGATAAMLRQLLGFVTGTVGRGNLGHD